MLFRLAALGAKGCVAGLLTGLRMLFCAEIGGEDTLGIRFTGREDGRTTGRGRGCVFMAFSLAT